MESLIINHGIFKPHLDGEWDDVHHHVVSSCGDQNVIDVVTDRQLDFFDPPIVVIVVMWSVMWSSLFNDRYWHQEGVVIAPSARFGFSLPVGLWNYNRPLESVCIFIFILLLLVFFWVNLLLFLLVRATFKQPWRGRESLPGWSPLTGRRWRHCWNVSKSNNGSVYWGGWLICNDMHVCVCIPILARASHFEYEQASLEIFWEIPCSHDCLYIFLNNAVLLVMNAYTSSQIILCYL